MKTERPAKSRCAGIATTQRHFLTVIKKIWCVEKGGRLLVFQHDRGLMIGEDISPTHNRPLCRQVERDPEKLRAAYRLGREAAEARLEEIETFIREAKQA